MTTATESVQLLRLPAVIEKTGLSRATLFRLIRDGSFPRPRKLTSRTRAFKSDEVQAWIDSRPVDISAAERL